MVIVMYLYDLFILRSTLLKGENSLDILSWNYIYDISMMKLLPHVTFLQFNTF